MVVASHQIDISCLNLVTNLKLIPCYNHSYFTVLDPPETDAATKEREELLTVLAELAGRLEHELKEVYLSLFEV